MSTWKNILTDHPAPGTGIRATDGKSVFVGHIMQNVPWFTGVSMDDGSEITISADLLTEWMPLAAPEKEKTADEMFGELGYSKVERGELIVYDHESYLKAVVVRKQDRTCEAVYNYPSGAKTVRMGYGEVLALARLIEETEGNNELD